MPLVPPEDSLGYQIRLTYRAFDRAIASRMPDLGLKAGYWHYLRNLWLQDGITQKELGDAINVKPSTVVAMMASMESAGLITRKKHATDARKTCIYLTAKGRKLEEKLLPIAAELNELATVGIPKRDIDKCLSVLKKLNKRLLGHEVS